MNTIRWKMVGICAAGLLLATGCSGGGNEPAPPQEAAPGESSSTQAPESSGDVSGQSSSEPGGDCSVHLFDEDNFDESDDNFVLTEPGRYENLSQLPGANKDWTDDADSIRVGAGATVTIWAEPGFAGAQQALAPGSEEPDLAFEPSSLEMSC